MNASDPREAAAEILEKARTIYAGDPAALRSINELSARLQEPLRLAIAGIVKAGKSTLLNALLGEEIAPTDSGECTRVVTWYRYSDTPRVTLYPRTGASRRLPIRRVDGKLVLELGDIPPEDVERIEVAWPSRVLQSAILIDTPGIASLSTGISARSSEFLTPDDAPSSADAIVYLLRHLHPSDVKFLEAFRDTAAGESKTVNAVAVLSRADEIGSGRIDSLLSARKVAMRYEEHGELASLALGVIPVAGLLAEAARTLREEEFAAFRTLAALDRAQREGLLISADRFVRPDLVQAPDAKARRRLLERFGIFGVRLAVSIIRMGVQDSAELAQQLVDYSGLEELISFVQLHFASRAELLKVRSVLENLARLLDERPPPDEEWLRGGIERMQVVAHGLRELSLLSDARVVGLPLSSKESQDAVRIVGGSGTSITDRLGLSEEEADVVVAEELSRQLNRWRARSHSPLSDRASVQVCQTVIRSLESVASGLATDGLVDALPDVVLFGRPDQGASESADEQS